MFALVNTIFPVKPLIYGYDKVWFWVLMWMFCLCLFCFNLSVFVSHRSENVHANVAAQAEKYIKTHLVQAYSFCCRLDYVKFLWLYIDISWNSFVLISFFFNFAWNFVNPVLLLNVKSSHTSSLILVGALHSDKYLYAIIYNFKPLYPYPVALMFLHYHLTVNKCHSYCGLICKCNH